MKSLIPKAKATTVVTATRITSQHKAVGGGAAVDLVLVIDTTGSMDDKIQALLETCREFVREMMRLGLSARVAVISFGDISVQGGGDKIEVVVPPTNNVEKVIRGLTKIPRNSGFGNVGESSLEALEKALTLQYRPGAVNVMLLITDEPALQRNLSAAAMTNVLRSREFMVFVVSPDEDYFRDMAKRTGGVWKMIGPTTDLAELLKMFREMAAKVAQVAKDVHELGGGSVAEYLKLTGGDHGSDA